MRRFGAIAEGLLLMTGYDHEEETIFQEPVHLFETGLVFTSV
jgi:hypothetical protein